ncbi:MAG TPA: LLM class flavin-dependent oxidoreductase, partial [Methylomirabilota bacterium]
MEFGLFAEQTRRGANQDDAFQEMFALVDAAESWGLDVFWLAEMLVNPARSVLSAPLLVASWIASRTKRL